MKIKRFKAPDMRQAIKMVREEHGADAVILSNRKVQGGIEIISAIDYDESAVETMLNNQGVEQVTDANKQVPQDAGTEFSDNPFLQTAFHNSALQNQTEHSAQPVEQSTEQPLNAQVLAQAYANNAVVKQPASNSKQSSNLQATDFQQAELQQQALHQQAKQQNTTASQVTHPVIEQAQQVIAAAAAMNAAHNRAPAPIPTPVETSNTAESMSPPQETQAEINDLNLEDDVATIRNEKTLDEAASEKNDFEQPPQQESIENDTDYDAAVSDVAQQLAESSTDERYRKKFDRETEQRNVEVQAMQRELHALKGMLSSRMNQTPQVSIPHVHPAHTGIYARLQELGISSSLCQEVLSKLPLSSEVNEGWRKALAILAHGLKTSKLDILEAGGVVAMVGSTGVGKTTSIAKLAARYALKHGRDKVAVVSVDNYRIAAQDQILSYGQMIGIPVFLATGRDDFNSIMGDLCDKQLILVDTAGMGQRDMRIGEQLELISEGPYDLNTYLVMSANTQEKALNQIAKAYADYDLSGCVLTKLDETVSLGGVLSMLTKWDIPISYMTEGQRVPEDIQKARPYSLVSKAVTMMQQVEMLDTSNSITMPNHEDIYNAHA